MKISQLLFIVSFFPFAMAYNAQNEQAMSDQQLEEFMDNFNSHEISFLPDREMSDAQLIVKTECWGDDKQGYWTDGCNLLSFLAHIQYDLTQAHDLPPFGILYQLDWFQKYARICFLDPNTSIWVNYYFKQKES